MMPRPKMSKSRSLLLCLAAYLAAGAAAAAVARLAAGSSALVAAALADVAATVVVFAFSLGLDNSSAYDPYWSVAPFPLGIYWLVRFGAYITPRQVVLLALVFFWAARLTMNWVRRWRGLADEDWRYADYRRLGPAYWPVSFLGFHLFPTILVFLGCLSLVPALAEGSRVIGALDLLAAAVTVTAIGIESIADRQLREFLAVPREPGQILGSGVWALSRHPNYFGEVLFWWGLYLFGLAANPSWWWTIIGPLAITALFLGVSVPMMDRRMLARHPGYAAHMIARSALVPLPVRRRVKV
jgi:steroid 5-alpha reductase family enzyme